MVLIGALAKVCNNRKAMELSSLRHLQNILLYHVCITTFYGTLCTNIYGNQNLVMVMVVQWLEPSVL